MRLIIDLKDKTHNKFKDICYDTNTSMSKVIREFVEQFVEATKFEKRSRTK